jgi:hypothetical protein
MHKSYGAVSLLYAETLQLSPGSQMQTAAGTSNQSQHNASGISATHYLSLLITGMCTPGSMHRIQHTSRDLLLLAETWLTPSSNHIIFN